MHAKVNVHGCQLFYLLYFVSSLFPVLHGDGQMAFRILCLKSRNVKQSESGYYIQLPFSRKKLKVNNLFTLVINRKRGCTLTTVIRCRILYTLLVVFVREVTRCCIADLPLQIFRGKVCNITPASRKETKRKNTGEAC